MTEPLIFSQDALEQIFCTDKMQIYTAQDIYANKIAPVVMISYTGDDSNQIVEMSQDELSVLERHFLEANVKRIVITNNKAFVNIIITLIKNTKLQDEVVLYFCNNETQRYYIRHINNQICIFDENKKDRISRFVA